MESHALVISENCNIESFQDPPKPSISISGKDVSIKTMWLKMLFTVKQFENPVSRQRVNKKTEFLVWQCITLGRKIELAKVIINQI